MTDLTSLIVVTYNSAGLLPAFFETLATTEGVRYEVIAVDNASSDGSLAALHRPGVRVIANSANLGFGRACNQGAAIAQGDLLVFLNPDITFTPGWLAALRRTLAERPEIGLIGPETPYPGEEPAIYDTPIEEVAALPGSALALRHSVWKELGGFDERIFLYWEDVDLCWRAWLLGWRVARDRSSLVYHTRGGSGGGSGWDAEALRAGLYVHLKLMRWRVALPFIVRQALVSLAKQALGRRGLGAAWAWNLRELGRTLAQRRVIASHRRTNPAELEARAARHRYTRRRYVRLWYTDSMR